MSDSFSAFRGRLAEIIDIEKVCALLHWDQEVNMPPKGAAARGEQLSTVAAVHHRLVTDAAYGGMLDDLAAQADALSEDEAALVREARYDRDRAMKIPEAFVRELAQEQSKAYEAWVKARKDSDFPTFEPNLRKIVDLLRQRADYLGYEGTPYNALLEDYERGMTADVLAGIFGDLATRQSALVARIMDSPQQPDVSWTEQNWDEDAQWAFTVRVLRDMGYDFDAGRQDRSVHPFTTEFDLYDVRVTTRVNARNLFSALMGSIHEGGHALYEQGYRDEDRRGTLAQAPSLGIHESQSRMWENQIGQSLPFWKHYADALRANYPSQLDDVAAEQIHAAVNRVAPGFIRVDADECTYNLHIILRFEIELALINGELDVVDVPGVWNEKVKQYLGLDVPDDAQGCLQDIHWSHGSMGYFPTYALGNLYAAQLLEKIEADVPALWEQVGQGAFGPLLGWLREHIHRVGRRKLAAEIVRDVTGREPDSTAYLRYLESKYGALYALD
jgi:carboxypeptidase Taq